MINYLDYIQGTTTIIDSNGKMQIDWSDPDLFKTVVPISILSFGTSRSED